MSLHTPIARRPLGIVEFTIELGKGTGNGLEKVRQLNPQNGSRGECQARDSGGAVVTHIVYRPSIAVDYRESRNTLKTTEAHRITNVLDQNAGNKLEKVQKFNHQ